MEARGAAESRRTSEEGGALRSQRRDVFRLGLVTVNTKMDEARRRLSALEERVPWNAVKKMWAGRRQEWVQIVGTSAVCSELAQQLIVLESMLKTDALSSAWPVQKNSWRARMSMCHEPKELELAVNELEAAIQWQRILVAPDGRPLSAAEIASGQFGVGGVPSVPLPPPLSVAVPPNPPEGVPRAAARLLVLLHSMGVQRYDPKVVVQLLDVMYVWSAAVLLDASAYARMRVVPTTPQLAYAPEVPIEAQDVSLAVRSRVEHGFTRVAAREVLAQQAADTNSEPMPILPKRTSVALPTDPAMWVPAARGLLESGGLDGDDDDDLPDDAPFGEERPRIHSWWHDRVARAAVPKNVKEENVHVAEPAPKRHKH